MDTSCVIFRRRSSTGSRSSGSGPGSSTSAFRSLASNTRDSRQTPIARLRSRNSGSLQLELIQQRNDAPSMFKDFIDAGNEGLQHVAYWPEDLDALVDPMLKQGYSIGQTAQVGEMGRFVYLETEAHPGTVIEISHLTPRRKAVFDKVREASEGWDGGDPIRDISV